MKILMVCLGNICRSPLAEGIMQGIIDDNQLPWEVDSAGTGSWHIGDPPDPRSIQTAKNHGLDIRHQRARQFTKADFETFDLILAMDQSNYENIVNLAGSSEQVEKVKLILDYDNSLEREVPDPYWDDNGFEHVFQLLDKACNSIIKHFSAKEISKEI